MATTKLVFSCPSARFLAWILILSIKISVDGSEDPPCPRNAVIDDTTNSLSSMNASGSGDEKRLECPCSLKTCLMLCCPFGKARIDGKCVDDNETLSHLPRVTPEVNERTDGPEDIYHTVIDDPCAIGWMEPFVLESFQVLLNGSIHSTDFEEDSILDFDRYCLFREPGSTNYSARVCRPKTWAVYDIFCLIIATLTMLAIFVGYTLVPELKNFHGLIFRSYIATYIGTYLASLGAELTIESRTHAKLFSVFMFFGHFTSISSALWLNVISFDIWRTFRVLRSMDETMKQRVMKRFIWYAMYAWIMPAILVGVFGAVTSYVPYFLDETFGRRFKQWSTVSFIISVCGCNSFMYTSTAITIIQQKKTMADLADETYKHHHNNKQLFKLHVKLFLIMKGHLVMWAVWLSWTVPLMTRLLVTMEVIQSFLIFFLFIWNDNVKRSIFKWLRETMSSVNQIMSSSKFSTSTNGEI